MISEWRADGAAHEIIVLDELPERALTWLIQCMCCGAIAHVLYNPGVVTAVCPTCLCKGDSL
jgi:hypothetical protein